MMTFSPTPGFSIPQIATGFAAVAGPCAGVAVLKSLLWPSDDDGGGTAPPILASRRTRQAARERSD